MSMEDYNAFCVLRDLRAMHLGLKDITSHHGLPNPVQRSRYCEQGYHIYRLYLFHHIRPPPLHMPLNALLLAGLLSFCFLRS
jgi:hypothetical protein